MSGPVILVTGANQGLGYAIIEVGARRAPHATWILASRDPAKGQAAAERLHHEAEITAPIEVVRLDVTNDTHVLEIAEYVSGKYGKLDVLINNAGQLCRPADDSLSALRKAYDEVCSINLSSAAVVTQAFMPLLHKAPAPKVLNITSGLGSIQNTLTKKMARFPAYGAAKIGMNGMSMHQQTAEKDRVEAEDAGSKPKSGLSFIKWYIITPGVLKTAFTNYIASGRDAKEGAEPAVRIALDDKDEYAYATNWEWVDNRMRVVPW